MQDLHISNKSDASNTANVDSNKLTLQELSEDQTSTISGGASAGISNRLSLTFNHNEIMVSTL